MHKPWKGKEFSRSATSLLGAALAVIGPCVAFWWIVAPESDFCRLITTLVCIGWIALLATYAGGKRG